MLKFFAHCDYKGRFEQMTLEDENGKVLWYHYGLPDAIDEAKKLHALLTSLGHTVDASMLEDEYYS